MSDEFLVHNCAPTLAGIKTASLFTCPCSSREEFLNQIRDTNKRLRHKGLRLLPLRFSENKALIYLYRPVKLSDDLSRPQAACLLSRCGYAPGSPQQHLCCLARKLRARGEFPHEIGLFLGYPVEDVQGFMENRACNCKVCGCWKVYGDPEAAKKKFAQYEKCARVYREQWEKGRDIQRLAVSG